MTPPGFEALGRELDLWSEAGRVALFWWRDDDAVAPGPALARLSELTARHAVPLALAVIPARLDAELGHWLQSRPLVSVLQHGYAHANHAAEGQRSVELGGTRRREQIRRDLQRGYAILERTFGARFVPVLVPPWNRIDPELLPSLPALGFRGLSTMRVRKAAQPVAGLTVVNAHLDPIHWRHDRGFVGSYPALAVLIQHLVARRTGYRDRAEPTGVLTHHLVQNEAVWRFSEHLLQFVSEHPAAQWIGAPEIWE